jgi:hypothetical protein
MFSGSDVAGDCGVDVLAPFAVATKTMKKGSTMR